MAKQASSTVNGPRSVAPPASRLKPMTVPDFMAAKGQGVRLTMLTAYDCIMARLLDAAGVDALLVGDSLGMAIQGNDNSLSVTLEEIIYHTRMVVRGASRSLVVADMPFMSYQVSPQQAVTNAGRLIKEGGAHAIKLEGGERSAAAVAAICQADIPVMGHVGLTPQSIRRLGGFRVQRHEEQVVHDAVAIEQAGAFAIVVECVPSPLAEKVTQAVKVPTIGIGAGAACDGQILVSNDMLGLSELHPRFVKQYADLSQAILQAAQSYCKDVRSGSFPGAEHEFH